MFQSSGIIQYSNAPLHKIWLLVDDTIGKYYRTFIPVKVNVPKYPTHVSVYRGGEAPNMDKWGLHEGRKIEFEYSGHIYDDGVYWWLEVLCKDLENIRHELGVPDSDKLTRSPDGRHKWHITIANNK